MSVRSAWLLGDSAQISIGQRDGPAPYLFSAIGDVHFLGEGGFVIVEAAAREIRLFDELGSFSHAFGAQGAGPGEFESVTTTMVTNDSIFVWDARLRRLSSFSLQGELGQAVVPSMPPYDGTPFVQGFFGEDAFLVRLDEGSPPPGREGVAEAKQTWIRWGLEGQWDTLATRAIADVYFADGGARPIPFMPLGKGRAAHDKFLWTTGERFEYLTYDRSDALERIVRVRAVPIAIPAQMAMDFREGPWSGMPLPDHFPLVDDLIVDDEERVWIRTFPAPVADSESNVWWVFTAEGEWLSTLEVPAELSLRAVSGNRLAGVWRDELAIPTIRVYEFWTGEP